MGRSFLGLSESASKRNPSDYNGSGFDLGPNCPSADRILSSTRVIAVDTPNSTSISSSWGSYRTTVDAIEAATGYNILSNVASSVQSVIEAKVDNGPTS